MFASGNNSRNQITRKDSSHAPIQQKVSNDSDSLEELDETFDEIQLLAMVNSLGEMLQPALQNRPTG